MEQKKFTENELNKIEQAVIKAQNGDKSGFEELYKFARNNCRYAAYTYINNKADADDAFQEAFLKVYQNINNIKSPRAFISYINTAINHTCYDMNKKYDNSHVDMFSDKEYEDGPEFLDTFVDESDYTKVDINIEHEERQQLIEEIMSDLSNEQKACVFAYYIQEISIKDIAKEYNVSENTIKSRLFQGRKKMEAKGNELKKRGIEFFGLSIVAFLTSLTSMEAKACEYVAPTFETTMAHITATKTTVTGAETINTAAKTGIKLFGKTISTKIAAISAIAIIGIGGIGAGIISSRNINQNNEYQNSNLDITSDENKPFYIYTDWDKNNKYVALEIEGNENNSQITYVEQLNDYQYNEIYDNYLLTDFEDSIENTPIYAKMYDDTIYLMHKDIEDAVFYVSYFNGDTIERKIFDYTGELFNSLLYNPDWSWVKVAYNLYDTNFDYSDWIDLTTLGTKGMSKKDAYNYSIEHQDEWIELLKATNEPSPEININDNKLYTESNTIDSNDDTNNDLLNIDSSSNTDSESTIVETSPFTGAWTNDFPGAFEGISHFDIDFDNMTYYSGDAYGDIIYIGNNQYKLHLKGFSDGTIVDEDDGIITIINNNDGTISINDDILKKIGTFSW